MGTSKEKNKIQKVERIGMEKLNKWGELMKVIEYNSYSDVVIEFQDEWKETRHIQWNKFEKGNVKNPHNKEQRLGLERYNTKGTLMRVVEYNGWDDVVVEFQDKWKLRKKVQWDAFEKGIVKNPHDEEIIKQRLGTIGYNNKGQLMKVIEYNNTDNITVEFQDEWKRTVTAQWIRFSNGQIRNPHDDERIGMESYNTRGELMKIIEYNTYNDIVVEFQNEPKITCNTSFSCFKKGNILRPNYFDDRVGQIKLNNQGSKMKCIEYNKSSDITIEFQDENKYKIKTTWQKFELGCLENPYFPDTFGVGISGNKYKKYNIINEQSCSTKEFQTWQHMLERCYDKKYKERQPTYKNVTCCNEWLYFPNFYEWLHSQENFEKWKNTRLSALDKDIIHKGNKLYSPDNCCLVTNKVNSLFAKNDANRGDSVIGLCYDKRRSMYQINCHNNNGQLMYLGMANNEIDGFMIYKEYKEKIIKKTAQEEYYEGNITKRCYEAMIKYEVEITD